ncbi:alpha/beta-hydrolase [Pluteus cervinus]|uniref:Alpha/beta-hydrolase n=1 Tax=Pluteus cervinus TaxID=181527 RepID=A0ACD3B9Z2_9AGAR|nr:alpha/beta-hydrolase [Pluteus cervinus]
MPGKALTGEVVLKTGPVVVETLIKHYFDSLKSNRPEEDGGHTKLRQDELLYDQAFSIVRVRNFLKLASSHTVEEVQAFANTRTPSPPWVHVIRVTVPLSCCDKAANILINTLGGEAHLKETIGGIRWWQVRGVEGIDAQWITAKKDWQEAERRHKMQEQRKQNPSDQQPAQEKPEAQYEEEMDDLRCNLYIHGGGYYFGSVDQERYSIQRHARKMNGRVFAINYRLAPQYPFPCALQDVLAAYLYLIDPPEGAPHRPIKPEHIVISGDSAGGGLALALLQIIRDTPDLSPPAGGILVSPWCDLTHSFQSITDNTDTDVMPSWGLSLHKPSTVWPPVNGEPSARVHASLRYRIQHVFRHTQPPASPSRSPLAESNPEKVTAPLPLVGSNEEIVFQESDGQPKVKIDYQIQLYAQNSLLGHPLISPVLSYLGGLPPLYILAGDKEVLRDEIIYLAHRAAYPQDFPVSPKTAQLYPVLNGIEERCKPTNVHLQVYDDAAHVLPVLFSFTTPAKYCFRAIASFTRFVTKMERAPTSPAPSSIQSPPRKLKKSRRASTLVVTQEPLKTGLTPPLSAPLPQDTGSTTTLVSPSSSPPIDGGTVKRTLSSRVSRATSYFSHNHRASAISGLPNGGPSRIMSVSSDVGGPRFSAMTVTPTPSQLPPDVSYAGDPKVYYEPEQWNGEMIRERVSTQGVIRPLEPREDLQAMHVPEDRIGRISEARALLHSRAHKQFQDKFAANFKTLEKERQQKSQTRDPHHPILLSKVLRVDQRSASFDQTRHGVKDGLMISAGMWAWAWSSESDDERPPPSSITARHDVEEARQLAKFADHAAYQHDQTVSGNRLWSAMVNFFTTTPDQHHTHNHNDVAPKAEHPDTTSDSQSQDRLGRRKSRIANFIPSVFNGNGKRKVDELRESEQVKVEQQEVPVPIGE